MFVTTFRYRVRPDRLGEYLDIQRRASQLYAQFVAQPPTYLQSANNPCEWLELHWFADEAASRLVQAQLGQHPEVAALWRQFQQTLDPSFPTFLEAFAESPAFHAAEERPALEPLA